MSTKPFKPTKEDMADAVNRRVRDVIAPGLKVLFCGINPGIYTAAVRRHFGRPGNRFWPALFNGGFTPRLFSPFENDELLALGYGITNLVARPTVLANELSDDELRRGAKTVVRKVMKYKPRYVAFCGVTSYRIAFDRPDAQVGFQPEHSIGDTKVWILPNPSGLNAHFTGPRLKEVFSELYRAVKARG